MPNYKGSVTRQALSDFCKEAAKPKMVDSGKLQSDIEMFESMGDNGAEEYRTTIHSLNEAIMENTGYQRAMRDVTEWARTTWEAERPKNRDINPQMDENNRFKDAEDPIAVIYQAVGAGSVCWENMSGTGVFQDDMARDAAYDAIVRLREMGVNI